MNSTEHLLTKLMEECAEVTQDSRSRTVIAC
jgi:hypothetical protein